MYYPCLQAAPYHKVKPPSSSLGTKHDFWRVIANAGGGDKTGATVVVRGTHSRVYCMHQKCFENSPRSLEMGRRSTQYFHPSVSKVSLREELTISPDDLTLAKNHIASR